MQSILSLVFVPFAFYSVFSLAPAAPTPNQLATIVVEVEGLRNSDGTVASALFKDASTFPNEGMKNVLAKPDSLHARLVYENVPYGTYALSVLHDENDNQQMERNDFGMPTEGFGFSNNPTINFGPPSFNATKFDVQSDTLTLRVRMLYF